MTTTNGGYRVVIENYGSPTSATNVTVNGGPTNRPVDIGSLNIPSGTTVVEFQLPVTTAEVSNKTYGNDGWLVKPVTISLSATEYTGLGLDHIE
jgi:hypothetical protein